jgi:type II secretory pathway component HofQ
MNGVQLSTVLGMLVAQLKGTYLVHNDYVELTTLPRTRVESWTTPGQPRDAGVAVAQMVDADFAKIPLDQALQALADQSGINVLLDPRAAESAKAAVSATLNHVPVDTAVQVLADMAGLKSLAIDNVIYVTTKDNASDLQTDLMRQRTGEGA